MASPGARVSAVSRSAARPSSRWTASRRSSPTPLAYVLAGRGQRSAADVLYAHDADRVDVTCDRPLPLQADGEDLGDVTEALFEAERDAVTVFV